MQEIKILLSGMFLGLTFLILIHAVLLTTSVDTSFGKALGTILFDLFN